MDNKEKSLNLEQAYESVPKITETGNKSKENHGFAEQNLCAGKETETKEAADRFRNLSLGCMIYALIYTLCMYKNKEAVTFPFFIGATLCFFYYYTKKYCTIVRGKNRFLIGSILVLSLLTCMTASSTVIRMNKTWILVLLCVVLLKTYYDVSGWSVARYLHSIADLICGSFLQIFTPFSDSIAFFSSCHKKQKEKRNNEQLKQQFFAIAAGAVVALPMLLFVLILLCGADVYFQQLFWKAVERVVLFFDRDIDFMRRIKSIVQIVMTVLIFFLLSYGVLVYLKRKNNIASLENQKQTQWNSLAAITFCSLIGMVYTIFVWVQIAGLFMGKLELPQGYTYAEYAREGFFQLVFVCIFNVCLVLVCMHCFKKHKILQVLLTWISLCTYVMLLSSAYRMFMYIGEYHLTFLRILVLWGIVVIAVIMAGVMIAVFKEKFPLFSYMLITITVCWIIFAAIHPDYVIARYNVSQAEQGEEIDEWYLENDLSLDASGVIFNMYEKKMQETNLLNEYMSGYVRTPRQAVEYYHKVTAQTEGMTLRSYNFSKAYALGQAKSFIENLDLEWLKLMEEYNW